MTSPGVCNQAAAAPLIALPSFHACPTSRQQVSASQSTGQRTHLTQLKQHGGVFQRSRSSPQPRHYLQRSLAACAARQRRPLDDDVEFDDGDSGEGFSIVPILRQGWSAASSVTDRLTDTLYDYAPEEVSRSTVSLAVRTALVLVLVGFARSLLGLVLTVGTVVLGLFVASRVLGIDGGGKPGQPGQPKSGRGRGGGKWGSGDDRTPRERQNRRLPSGIAKDSDLLDVWFEAKDAEVRDRQRRL